MRTVYFINIDAGVFNTVTIVSDDGFKFADEIFSIRDEVLLYATQICKSQYYEYFESIHYEVKELPNDSVLFQELLELDRKKELELYEFLNTPSTFGEKVKKITDKILISIKKMILKSYLFITNQKVDDL